MEIDSLTSSSPTINHHSCGWHGCLYSSSLVQQKNLFGTGQAEWKVVHSICVEHYAQLQTGFFDFYVSWLLIPRNKYTQNDFFCKRFFQKSTKPHKIHNLKHFSKKCIRYLLFLKRCTIISSQGEKWKSAKSSRVSSILTLANI